jgi:hypothetical protein
VRIFFVRRRKGEQPEDEEGEGEGKKDWLIGAESDGLIALSTSPSKWLV